MNNKYDIQDLVTATYEQKPINFSNAFDSLIVDKLQTAVSVKKQEMAQKMFNHDYDDTSDSEDYEEE
jgi:hypothetical protein